MGEERSPTTGRDPTWLEPKLSKRRRAFDDDTTWIMATSMFKTGLPLRSDGLQCSSWHLTGACVQVTKERRSHDGGFRWSAGAATT